MDDLDFGQTVRGFSAGQTVFRRFTLKKILGRGGMGVVWLARDEELERDVALKFLPETVAADKEAVRDLKRETRRSLELTHPNIVRIYDFLQDGSTAAISMEYVAGETLAARKLEQPHGCFEAADLAGWTEQICAALTYAHEKAKVVHRDLKPANLMVTEAGDLKIADFGIAASVSDSVSRVSVQSGSSGTPIYMSPQQMMGEKPAVTDDIYALGATLFELLAGKPPFYSGNVIAQVQGKVAPPMMDRRKELGVEGEELPPEWEETVAVCLAKETADRPQSAGDVAERLGLKVEGGRLRIEDGGLKGNDEVRMTNDELAATGRKKRLTAGYWLLAAVLVFAGVGYFFGVHAPERERRAEAARVEAERQAAGIAEVRAREARDAREQAVVLARIESVLDGVSRDHFNVVAEAVASYLENGPERLRAEVESAWTRRTAGWERHRLATARGGVIVTTRPEGAQVRVGAVANDRSPLTLSDQRLGTYPVRISKEGYESWEAEIEVTENAFAEIDIDLVRSTGQVQLTSVGGDADAMYAIYEDGANGEEVASGRLPADLTLPVGGYEFVGRRPGPLGTIESRDRIVVTRNESSRLSVDLSGGELVIDSVPEGADVILDGTVVGRTPRTLTEVPLRTTVSVEVRRDGYGSVKNTFELTESAPAERWTARLERAFQRPDFTTGPRRFRVDYRSSATTETENTTDGTEDQRDLTRSETGIISIYEVDGPDSDGLWTHARATVESRSGEAPDGAPQPGETVVMQRDASGDWTGIIERRVDGSPIAITPIAPVMWLGSEYWPDRPIRENDSWSVPVRSSFRLFGMTLSIPPGTEPRIEGRVLALTADFTEIEYVFDVTGQLATSEMDEWRETMKSRDGYSDSARLSGTIRLRLDPAASFVNHAEVRSTYEGTVTIGPGKIISVLRMVTEVTAIPLDPEGFPSEKIRRTP